MLFAKRGGGLRIMRVHVEQHPDYWILCCEPATAGLAPGPIPEVILGVKSGIRAIIVSLAQIDYINPIGVKAIMDSIDFASGHKVGFSICETKAFVRRTLRLNGLCGKVPVYATRLLAQSSVVRFEHDAGHVHEIPEKILVVQNEVEIAQDLRTACGKHSSKPEFVLIPMRSLRRTTEFLHMQKIDCILIDAGFRLFEVNRLISGIYCSRNFQEIPIIIVTRDKNLGEADVMVRHGATEILRHPFDPIETVTRLQTLICLFKDRNMFTPPKELSVPFGMR